MSGVSGEADELEKVDILAVSLNSYGGRDTNLAVSQEPLVQLTPNLNTV